MEWGMESRHGGAGRMEQASWGAIVVNTRREGSAAGASGEGRDGDVMGGQYAGSHCENWRSGAGSAATDWN